MARQRKTLPARRNGMDDSLLIRSAESLGRVIGSLQRQLDAARQVVSTRQIRLKADTTGRRGNGQAPAHERVNGKTASKTKPATKRKVIPRLATRARSGQAARKQSSTKRRPPKTR